MTLGQLGRSIILSSLFRPTNPQHCNIRGPGEPVCCLVRLGQSCCFLFPSFLIRQHYFSLHGPLFGRPFFGEQTLQHRNIMGCGDPACYLIRLGELCSFLFADFLFQRHFAPLDCSLFRRPFWVKKHPQHLVHRNTLESGEWGAVWGSTMSHEIPYVYLFIHSLSNMHDESGSLVMLSMLTCFSFITSGAGLRPKLIASHY